METIIKELNNLRPTKEQVKDKPAYYAFGYVDAINSAIEVVKNNAVLPHVSNSALHNNNKLIENMCLSYRHDFGLMKEEEKNELRFQCKEWLKAYENNREHCC